MSEKLHKLKPQCGTSAYLINKKACKYFIQYTPLDIYVDVLTNDNQVICNLINLFY